MLFPEHFKLLSMSKLYSDGQFNKIDIDGMQMLPDEVIFVSSLLVIIKLLVHFNIFETVI